MNRRRFLQGLMAGGVIVAGELWVPGQKLISIPSGRVFTGVDLALGGDVCSIQICEKLPGDRVRVVAYYADGPDPVEYMVKNVMSNKISIEVPLRDEFMDDVEVITAKPGDMFSRFVSAGSHLEDSGLIHQACIPPKQSVGCRPVTELFKRKEYVFEDLNGVMEKI